MSEATTYEIELDALPGLTLERDHPFQQDIGIQAHEFDATTESNSPGFNSRNNACLTTVPSGFRMVNLIKEEKSLYLLGVSMPYSSPNDCIAKCQSMLDDSVGLYGYICRRT